MLLDTNHARTNPNSTPKSRWPLPLAIEWLLSALKRAARYILKNGLTVPGVYYLLALAAEQAGFRKGAARLYRQALSKADTSSSARIFQGRQSWEFHLERNEARRGRPRVEDPLFSCSATPTALDIVPKSIRRKAPGYFEARFTHRGLSIDGFLRASLGQAEVEILIDGNTVRSSTTSMAPLGFPVFVLDISREALQQLPARCRLSVRRAGESLLYEGSESASLHLPQGCRAPTQPIKLDKKGYLIEPDAAAGIRQGFMEIYERASRYFATVLNRDLFLLYGTLLGQRRNGDFIPGDDDFDVGYYSDAARSEDVRSECMEMVIGLVSAGFVVSVNMYGRLFRLSLPGMPSNCHLDVHTVWIENGSLWIHPSANLDCQRADFLPTKTATFGKYQVRIPNRPEAFLEAYYGHGWQVPDPSYSTAARHFPRWKARHLKKSRITPRHVKYMQERISDNAGCEKTEGALIAIGLQPMYPLEIYQQSHTAIHHAR